VTRNYDLPHYELRLIRCPLSRVDEQMQEAVRDGFHLHTFTMYGAPPMAVSGPIVVAVMEKSEREDHG
jgi:hypothetical protein